jgi:hypothetical protein
MAHPPDGDAISGAADPGVAAAQLCGTDIAPTRVARPIPADTIDPPRPGEPSVPNPAFSAEDALAPVSMPGLTAPPKPWPATAKNPMSAKALVTAGLTLAGFTQLPDRKPFMKPELKNEPKDEPVDPLSKFSNPEIPVVA